MPVIAFLRHAPTDWNEKGRFQGQADVPLSAKGRARLSGYCVPAPYRTWPWVTSPLCRARETAQILGLKAVVEPAVIEMAWGQWEGRDKVALRAELGPAFQRNEARGLDFRPEGGESPREVQARLLDWARRQNTDTGVVAHKGVIRAVYAAATHWPMLGKPLHKLDWRCVQVFDIRDTAVEIVALNRALEVP